MNAIYTGTTFRNYITKHLLHFKRRGHGCSEAFCPSEKAVKSFFVDVCAVCVLFIVDVDLYTDRSYRKRKLPVTNCNGAVYYEDWKNRLTLSTLSLASMNLSGEISSSFPASSVIMVTSFPSQNRKPPATFR